MGGGKVHHSVSPVSKGTIGISSHSIFLNYSNAILNTNVLAYHVLMVQNLYHGNCDVRSRLGSCSNCQLTFNNRIEVIKQWIEKSTTLSLPLLPSEYIHFH